MKNTIVSFAMVLMLVSCLAVDKHSGNDNTNVDVSMVTPLDNVVLKLFDQETFDTQRQLWLDQNLQNYSFCLSNHINPALPTWSSTVIIKDGIVDSVSSENPAYGDTWQEFAVPISGIYDYIIRSRDRVEADAKKTENKDSEFQYSYTLEIEYDTEYHFPKSFSSTFVFDPKEPEVKLEGNGRYSIMTITNFTIAP